MSRTALTVVNRTSLISERAKCRKFGVATGLLAILCIVFAVAGDGHAGEYRTAKKHRRSELALLRRRAESGDRVSQRDLAIAYAKGEGVIANPSKALRWATLAANQGDTIAQCLVGAIHENGFGVQASPKEAFRWYAMAAEAGDTHAQSSLGRRYVQGKGVPQDFAKAEHWLNKSARQGDAAAQIALAWMYFTGSGVQQNTKTAYAWAILSRNNDNQALVNEFVSTLASELTSADIEDAERLANEFAGITSRFQVPQETREALPEPATKMPQLRSCGSGFFITTNGYFVTNEHVVRNAAIIRIKTAVGDRNAEVVRVDADKDIAILKVEGTFEAVYVRGSRELRMADRVATIGYPAPDVQGTAPKYSAGEVASLSGMHDDANLLQISVPLQPGNSGGPLIDTSGGVVGVIVSQWNKDYAIRIKGIIPENVNYAVKGTILLAVIESVPEAFKNLAPPPPADLIGGAAEIAARVEPATGLVLVYE